MAGWRKGDGGNGPVLSVIPDIFSRESIFLLYIVKTMQNEDGFPNENVGNDGRKEWNDGMNRNVHDT